VQEFASDGSPRLTQFVLVTGRNHIHLLYDEKNEHMEKFFPIDSKNPSTRVRSVYPSSELTKLEQPSIDLQPHTLKVQDEYGVMRDVTHYFFLDNKNEVQLIYPNYR
jgi:hypothetical protein